jgi:hypothetical protein
MLLKESENAQLLRSKMPDIVIDTITKEQVEGQNSLIVGMQTTCLLR